MEDCFLRYLRVYFDLFPKPAMLALSFEIPCRCFVIVLHSDLHASIRYIERFLFDVRECLFDPINFVSVLGDRLAMDTEQWRHESNHSTRLADSLQPLLFIYLQLGTRHTLLLLCWFVQRILDCLNAFFRDTP